MAEFADMVKQVTESSDAELTKLTKQQLVDLVRGTVRVATQQDQQTQILQEMNEKLDKIGPLEAKINGVDVKVADISSKMTEMQGTLATHSTQITAIAGLQQEFDTLKTTSNDSFKDIYKTLEYLQRFAEGLDAHQRGRNLILLGVPETDGHLGTTELERIENVIEKTGAMSKDEIGETQVKRLGSDTSRRPRPLLINLEDNNRQRKIIMNAKNLKNIPGYSDIYIKKDVHPTVRHEFNRLRKAEKEMKANPDNRGADIRYDHKDRVITRNGIVVDRFSPAFQ